jgi:hypothetical protein
MAAPATSAISGAAIEGLFERFMPIASQIGRLPLVGRTPERQQSPSHQSRFLQALDKRVKRHPAGRFAACWRRFQIAPRHIVTGLSKTDSDSQAALASRSSSTRESAVLFAGTRRVGCSITRPSRRLVSRFSYGAVPFRPPAWRGRRIELRRSQTPVATSQHRRGRNQAAA